MAWAPENVVPVEVRAVFNHLSTGPAPEGVAAEALHLVIRFVLKRIAVALGARIGQSDAEEGMIDTLWPRAIKAETTDV